MPINAKEFKRFAIAAEIEGINILLERQKYLLEDLKGNAQISGMMDLLDQATKEQQASLQALKDLQVNVIKSQKEVFVDPVWGTEVENKGLKAFYANIVTLGQAKTKIKCELETVDTKGLHTIEDFIQLCADIAKNGGKIDGKVVAEDDIKALDALIGRYETAEKLQKELEERIATFLTATTEEEIANAIVDGFQSGKSAAADFADTFEEMMRNTIINGVKADIMNEQLKAFYAKLKQYASDGLDQGEINELRNDYENYVKESEKIFDAASQVTGIDLTNNDGKGPNSQQGWITGVSQETAGKLEGQFNALRISGADIMVSNRQVEVNTRSALLELSNISRNTAELYAMRRTLDNIDRVLNSDWFRSIGGL